MNNVMIIDPANDIRWDSFVENHPLGWISHLSGWKVVLEKSFRHMKGHYLALVDSENCSIKAALPLFEVRSRITGNRLVSIPFATLSAPLVSSVDDMEELFEATLNLSKLLGVKKIDIGTFLSSSSLIQDERFGVRCFYKHHYLELEKGPDQLMKSFHRSCVRQRISRAVNSNLDLKVGDNESDLHSFYSLHLKTRKRLGLPPQPYIYFKTIWEVFFLEKRIMLILAEHKKQPVAGLLLLKFGDRVSAEFSVSDEVFRDLSPLHYLFWEAIKSACDEGYKIFDFGRTSPSNKTLMDFKARWGTQVNDLPRYYYPKQICKQADERENSLIYSLIKMVCRHTPDPFYPHLGSCCYKHLG